jgi:hypothetical protein
MSWERCSEPIRDKSRSYHLRGVPKNTIWGSFGPLGPSRGICRPNRTAKSRNKSCIGQIGAVWKCVLVSGANKPFQRLENSKIFMKNRYSKKKKSFFCSSSQSAHRHRHDEHIMLQTRSAAEAHLGLTFPSNGNKIQQIQINRFFLKTVFFFLKTFLFSLFLFEFYHRVPIATGRRNILCCRRGAPQAH